uniref:Uncharacterized protein n=1 Tax=Arundo donax TaxID=35708 RepID=A0A0A9GW03_ARUDO
MHAFTRTYSTDVREDHGASARRPLTVSHLLALDALRLSTTQ